ncbi:deferrochelatase/peroxidase EfeB, partial [Streptomyces sp. SID2131]|nr:deferrochelatase/peroxidase EfeB [Streptomyces sp. SID2131]
MSESDNSERDKSETGVLEVSRRRLLGTVGAAGAVGLIAGAAGGAGIS